MYDLSRVMSEKQSRLCIGIDPRVKHENRSDFGERIVSLTHKYAMAYKPNIQFWHGTPKKEILSLTDLIHSYDLPVIADLKISDIGSTNKAGLENMYSLGFDYITHSPFPGNIIETSDFARSIGIGLITLVVMSNQEAKWMISSGLFRDWAKQVEQYCSGAVIGTTGHISVEILKEIADLIPSKLILAPGIGSQGGKSQELMKIFKERVFFNVSRGINQSDNPEKSAEMYYNQILGK